MGEDGFRMQSTASLPVTVRLTRAADLPALEWYGLYTHMREVIQSAFRAQTRGDVAMLVADINGFPAAQAWVDFVRKSRLGLATVWAVRVFPPFQRGGLGTLVMQAAEREVLRRGMGEAELGVDRDNAGVLSFYRRLGYVTAGSERGCFAYRTPDGTPVEVMVDQWLLRKRLVTERPRLAVR
ncbi:MAG TPA: GNAT family N-acetyltransferase [Azospirillum sp.]|nr:GNAT family N-acetyltransferase [Azospirillum sp.]